MNKRLLYRIFVVSIIFLVSLSPLIVLDVNAQQENSWTSLTPMPTPRAGIGVAVVDNKIYVIGGSYWSNYFGINEMYDPATNTWTTKTSMPTPRASFGITVFENKIYVIGGATDAYVYTCLLYTSPSPRD